MNFGRKLRSAESAETLVHFASGSMGRPQNLNPGAANDTVNYGATTLSKRDFSGRSRENLFPTSYATETYVNH
jgi:hypothetical protein